MTKPPEMAPYGTQPVSGVSHRESRLPVPATVEKLTETIEKAGAKIFAVIDQRAEAEAVGLSLRDTVLVIFGNPAAGTPVMASAPLSALDLPLKILVWADDQHHVWMTYLTGAWLAERHGLPTALVQALGAAETLTSHVPEA
jgi:uncharacterized protein (DUF302 family)